MPPSCCSGVENGWIDCFVIKISRQVPREFFFQGTSGLSTHEQGEFLISSKAELFGFGSVLTCDAAEHHQVGNGVTA